MSSQRGLLDARTAGLLAGAAVLAGLVLHVIGAFGRVELATVDTRFAVRGSRAPDTRVVGVKIDADTFGALGRGWPFPRRLHARVIDRLRVAGARAIAYDVQFSEPTIVTQDNALINAVRRAGIVALAATEVDTSGTANVFGSGSAQRAARVQVGFAGFPVEPGAVIRKVPSSVDGLPSFARVAAAIFERVPADRRAFAGDAWIDFAGPPGSFPAIDFADVLDGTFDAEKVRGRVVVIGAYASSLQDVHPTSVAPDGLMAGAEVQANAIATLLRGRPLGSAPWMISVLAILALGGVVPLAAIRLRLALVEGVVPERFIAAPRKWVYSLSS